MLVRSAERVLEFASDDGTKRLTLDSSEFAHIAFVSSSCEESEVILTAAREKSDVADVASNNKGRYRAYRLSGQGLTRITDEYTSTAIRLPGGDVAYTNGNALVVQSGERLHTHKMGKFNWGPPSLSANEDGSRVAVVKWKGDDRKLLLYNPRSGEALLSKFSLYSYVLHGESVFYQGGDDIRLFNPLTGKSQTITTQEFGRGLLETCAMQDLDVKRVYLGFSRLSMVHGKLLAAFRVADPNTFEPHAIGVVGWLPGSKTVELLFRLREAGRWTIEGIESTGAIARAVLARFEERSGHLQQVETKTAWLTPRPAWCADSEWSLIGSPQVPDFGIQFLPHLLSR